eukprot:CAMPEP_0115827768 /NCGR_PEP_ID=MMETSP0287-20121206/217_1 /TAXON_ID=412157 /ORGANISM="Chrysochromulina rotalis, Strain UIO044" /LENGTH=297 /DNA_ID=CAMNT_0003280941 /DNA_START=117 /DNA_END=1010 /DNA_ORIENTATION=+
MVIPSLASPPLFADFRSRLLPPRSARLTRPIPSTGPKRNSPCTGSNDMYCMAVQARFACALQVESPIHSSTPTPRPVYVRGVCHIGLIELQLACHIVRVALLLRRADTGVGVVVLGAVSLGKATLQSLLRRFCAQRDRRFWCCKRRHRLDVGVVCRKLWGVPQAASKTALELGERKYQHRVQVVGVHQHQYHEEVRHDRDCARHQHCRRTAADQRGGVWARPAYYERQIAQEFDQLPDFAPLVHREPYVEKNGECLCMGESTLGVLLAQPDAIYQHGKTGVDAHWETVEQPARGEYH